MFSNSRGWIFLSIVSLFFMILGQLLLGRQGLLFGFLIGSALNVYVFFLSERVILSFYEATLLKGQDPWGINTILKKVSLNYRSPEPEVFICQSKSPFIFCSHKGWGKNKIIISESLIDKLDTQELQDLLSVHAYYMLNNFSLFVGFRTQIIETIFLLCRAVDYFVSIPFVGLGKEPIFPFEKLFLPIAKLLNKSYNKNLLTIDSELAKNLGSPEKLSKLIFKLESLNSNIPINAPPSPSVVFLVNPLTEEKIDSYFHRHFSAQDRIKNLIGYYPL